jgi:hypothetical protein
MWHPQRSDRESDQTDQRVKNRWTPVETSGPGLFVFFWARVKVSVDRKSGLRRGIEQICQRYDRSSALGQEAGIRNCKRVHIVFEGRQSRNAVWVHWSPSTERFLVTRVPQTRPNSAFMDERAFNSTLFPPGSTWNDDTSIASSSGNAIQPRDSFASMARLDRPISWTKPRHGIPYCPLARSSWA